MKTLRSSGLIGIMLLLTVLLVACGQTAMQGTPTNTANQGMNNQNAMNNKTDTGMMYATPSATSKMNTNNNGNMVNVLMTNKGFAVYYYRADTMFKATCTGQCAHDWPPILAPQGMMTVSSSMALPRQLSVHQTPNGAQVFYDGHALYTYASDKQAGTATGRAQDMQWYLVGLTL